MPYYRVFMVLQPRQFPGWGPSSSRSVLSDEEWTDFTLFTMNCCEWRKSSQMYKDRIHSCCLIPCTVLWCYETGSVMHIACNYVDSDCAGIAVDAEPAMWFTCNCIIEWWVSCNRETRRLCMPLSLLSVASASITTSCFCHLLVLFRMFWICSALTEVWML